MHDVPDQFEEPFRAVTRSFEAICAARPEAVAVVHNERTMTYAELNAASNRLAAHLGEIGIEPEILVGVCMARSCDWVATILAIWKAGAAYLPLDPQFPSERLASQLDRAAPAVVVGTDHGLAALGRTSAYITSLDEDHALIAARDPENRAVEIDPRTLACVLYTSGSTGQPKAIAMQHGGLANLARGIASAFRVSSDSVVLQFYPVTADAALTELLPALTTGARLVISDRDVNVDPARLGRLFEDERISVATCPPQVLASLVDRTGRLPALRSVISAGEACTAELATAWSTGRRFFNAYGPAEYTCTASWFEASDEQFKAPPPIGRPFEATELHVLDNQLTPVLVGGEGELYIGGAGLTRGYYGEPALTAERFVPHPRPARPGARLYRTGDRCRRLPDGNLAFVGRTDHQVKIRGFRVEPAEVSAALERDPAVARAFTMGRRDGEGPVQLVSYVVPRDGAELDVDKLRAGVGERLPDYMIPSLVMAIAELPLTRHGKVDRNALPPPQRRATVPALEPLTPSEEIIARVWSELLEVPVTTRSTHFFDAGGHSLIAVRVVARLAAIWPVELPVGLLFDYPVLSDFARVVADERRATTRARTPIVPRPRRDVGPLSHAQERLWFVEQVANDAGLYTTQAVLRARGSLDLDLLARALDAVVARHDILRSALVCEDGTPVQCVQPVAQFALETVDRSGRNERAALELVAHSARVPFDLARPPLVRVLAVRLGPGDAVLAFTAHHAVIDFASFPVLHRELGWAYDALRAGRPLELPALPIQYADYAAWERSPAGQADLEHQLAHWTAQLAGELPVLGVPTARPRSAALGRDAAFEPVRLPDAVADRLRTLARDEGATSFMILLAVWFALLSRYVGQTDLVVGTPVASRSRPETQGLIGLFLNMLPLRIEIRDRESFTELLRRVRSLCLDAYAHQDLPFGLLVQAINPPRDLAVDPIFQVQFLLQHLPAAIELSGVRLEPVDAVVASAQFDLNLGLVERDGAIEGKLIYRRALFDPALMQRMARHFERLAGLVADRPDCPLGELPLVDPDELRTQLVDFNRTAQPLGDALLVPQQIARTARRTPDAIAVSDGDRSVTYGELWRRVEALAHTLRAAGVGPDRTVGLLCDRSLELIVGALAILDAGGAYVPLDPSDPVERLRGMVEDAGCAALLHPPALHDAAAAIAGLTRCVPIELDREAPAAAPPVRGAELHPDHLVHVIYTSGSTGRPKGVLSSHRGLHNRLVWMQRAFGLTADDVVLFKTPHTFDVSVWEMFWPLMVGARQVIARPGGHRDAEYLVELIRREGVTTVHFVPSMLQAILDQPELSRCRTLRRVVCSGEPLQRSQAQRLFQQLDAELHNLYGPTEASIDVSHWACSPVDDGPIPIGRPIDNVRLHVLDRNLQPVPVGVTGELYIGGVALARGYVGQPGLTADRFVPDPFGDGARLYRTGDQARYRPDGVLEFLGRLDGQRKLRGVRIELGEIEAALRSHPAVSEAVAVIKRSRAAEALVAYVTPRPGAALVVDELRDHAAARLPHAMRPAAICVLSAWPRTRSGKLDTKALPDPFLAIGAGAPEPPGDPDSPVGVLCRAFTEVLGVAASPGANFFDLGGHSMLATRLVARLRAATGRALALPHVFEHPTPAELATVVARLPRADLPPLTRGDRGARSPLSFSQHRLWFLDQLEPGNPFYNTGLAVRLRGALDAGALVAALEAVVTRHAILRTVLPAVDGIPQQVVLDRADVPFELRSVRSVDEPAREAAALRIARDWMARPFDLARGPVLRALLCEIARHDQLLVIATHHIAADGGSMRILQQELLALYQAGGDPARAGLRALEYQYADFAAWQHEVRASAAFAASLAFWHQELAELPVLELPGDRPRPAQKRYLGGTVSRQLPAALTTQLALHGQRAGGSPLMTLAAGLAALLYRLSGQRDFAIGTPVSGRTLAQVEPLIGCFINTLALRTSVAPGDTFDALYSRVRASCLRAYAHQEVAFDQLVEQLNPERSAAHAPLCQVMIVYAEAGAPASIPGLEVAPVEVDLGTAALDLTLFVRPSATGLQLVAEYDADRFDADSVAAWLSAYEALLSHALHDPSVPVDRLALLDDATREHPLRGTGCSLDTPAATRLEALIARTAAATPDAIALVAGDASWSYAELERAANRLAQLLVRRGIGADTNIAVCLPHGPELVAALLAVLKAGAAYVPLDPLFPAERLAWMLDDAAPAAIITVSRLSPTLRSRAPQVLLDRSADELADCPDVAPRAAHGAEAACYVLYTSGSTGRPKGVVVPHRAVVNVLFAMQDLLALGPGDRWVAATTASFDVAAAELFLPLVIGARVRLVDRDLAREPSLFANVLDGPDATVFQATPSAWRLLLAAGWSPRTPLKKISGGEALPADLARRLTAGGGELWNFYGPTETTVWSSASRVAPGAERVTLGRALGNNLLYVVADDLALLPPGVPGELCIGGRGVAHGYLGQPALTAERFVPDPFAADGSRMYRTGDRARYRASGELEWLGRLDQQVKVRGVRIELDEIELALRAVPGVIDAAAVARDDADRGVQLIAFYASADRSLNERALRQRLEATLPVAMIPSALVCVDELPRTPNGKLDRRRLRDAELEAAPAPFTGGGELADRLLAIWRQVLGRPDLGFEDDLFDHGADSLAATRAAARATTEGMRFLVRDAFEHGTVRALVASLRPVDGAPAGIVASQVGGERVVPATAMQRGLLFFARAFPGASEYVEQYAFQLARSVDPGALERAWNIVQARHDVLRARAGAAGAGPALYIAEACALPWRACTDGRSRAEILADDLQQPLDLDRGPLFRLTLIERPDGARWLLWTVHHVLVDAWSAARIIIEVAAAHDVIVAGQALALPPARANDDFAAWQAAQDLAPARAYFERRFASDSSPSRLFGKTAALQLPADPARYAQARRSLGPERSARATRLASRLRISQASLFHGLWAILHSRHGAGARVTFGSVMSGRSCPLPAMDERVGLFINALPIVVAVDGSALTGAWLQTVHRELLALGEHEGVPLDRVRDWTGGSADALMFESILVFDPLAGHAMAPGAPLALIEPPVPRTGYPLHVEIWPGDDLVLRMTYDEQRFEAAEVEALLDHACALLDDIDRRPDAPIARLGVLRDAGRAELVRLGQGPRSDDPRDGTFLARFDAQVAHHGARIAATCGTESLTYRELDERASRLAGALLERGARPDSVIALLDERGLDMLCSMLAAFKLGAAYLPLDPRTPPERLCRIIERGTARWVVTAPRFTGDLEAGLAAMRDGERPQLIDARPILRAAAPAPRLPVRGGPRHLAYVIFTSGSTGEPKGAMIEQHGMLNHLFAKVRDLSLSSSDVVLQTAPQSFDIAVWQFLSALVVGGTTRVVPDEIAHDPAALVRELVAARATVVEVVPSHLRALLDSPAAAQLPGSLRWMITTGEALPPGTCREWSTRFTSVPLVNAYGPTECSDDVTHAVFRAPEEHASTPIGRPIANTELYVLDAAGELAPRGVPGELCVGGDGVGRGYLGDPARTALAFVPDPFSGRAGARLYRTGDQVRWRPDGQLEFRGRRDFQVKLRGHRIELGDVEAALAAHGAVAQAVAMIQGEGPRARLVAFVVPRAGHALVAAELGEYVATRLPYYMVPTTIVAIDALPLTATQKVDRARLPMLDSSADAPREGKMPEGELEYTIARVWREVLERDAVTTTDNFFDLGGTSFRMVQVRARLSEVLGRAIELHDLFRYPTIRSLARALHDPADAAAPPDEAGASVTRRAERQRAALRHARKHRGGGK